jgi:hypothetical protein
MPGLNQADREFARLMRNLGALEDVQNHQVDHRNGVILVSCGDCDQSYDIFTYEVRMCQGLMVDPRIHQINLNGGPLLLVSDSRLNCGLPQDEVVLMNVAEAVVLKNISQVCLQAHNCGKAKLLGYNLESVFSDACNAHDRTKHELLDHCQRIAQEWKKSDNPETRAVAEKFNVNKIRTSLFVHLDWGDRKRKYFLNRNRFRAFASGELRSPWAFNLRADYGGHRVMITD